MSGADTLQQRAKRFVQSLPGRRESQGGTIPDHTFHDIIQSARGVTLTTWGRHPTPEQIQWLYDNGHHSPAEVRAAYGNMPHPHAPGLTVGEYPQYASTYKMYRDHLKR